MSEKSLNCYHGYKKSAINTKVKNHIPLEKHKEFRNSGPVMI